MTGVTFIHPGSLMSYFLQKLAGKLYQAAHDGTVDAYDVRDVLGVKREEALASVDPATLPAPQQAPPTVNGTAATAAPSSGNFFPSAGFPWSLLHFKILIP